MHRARFPLYLKVLALFLLNLALLAGGLGFLLRSQFGLGLDSVMGGKSGERIDRALQLISDELTETDRPSWDSQLARFSEAYGVTFTLFRSNGEQVAGSDQQLPAEILANSGGTNRIVKPLIATHTDLERTAALEHERSLPFGTPDDMAQRMSRS